MEKKERKMVLVVAFVLMFCFGVSVSSYGQAPEVTSENYTALYFVSQSNDLKTLVINGKSYGNVGKSKVVILPAGEHTIVLDFDYPTFSGKQRIKATLKQYFAVGQHYRITRGIKDTIDIKNKTDPHDGLFINDILKNENDPFWRTYYQTSLEMGDQMYKEIEKEAKKQKISIISLKEIEAARTLLRSGNINRENGNFEAALSDYIKANELIPSGYHLAFIASGHLFFEKKCTKKLLDNLKRHSC